MYHCLATTHYANITEEVTAVDINAVSGVVDVTNADSLRKCTVNEVPAILCEKKGRVYLCWTLSHQYSFVIEYTPEVVLEEEIFRMAEDLHLP